MKNIRLLLVEDSPCDAELILAHVEAAGYKPDWQRVDTANALDDALRRQNWDVILSDWEMPGFRGQEALRQVLTTKPDIPFIIVSDALEASNALAIIQAGASNWVPKSNLSLLATIIGRELLRCPYRRISQTEQSSLRLLTAAVEHAANAIVITNRNGDIIWTNPAFTLASGYSAEEVHGRNPRFLKSGKHDQAFYKNLWDTILAGKVWRSRVVNRRKDGRLYTIEQTITPVKADNEEITHFIAIEQDVTDRQEVENALRESKALYQSLVEAPHVAVFRKDREGRFVYVNNLLCQLLGRPRGEIVGKTDFDVSPKPLAEKYRRDDLLVMANGQVFDDIELHNPQANGKSRWIQIVKSPVRDADGEIIGVQGLIWDVTQRKQAEDALRANEARFRAVMDHLGEWVWEVDESGCFNYASAVSVKILGYHPEELTGNQRFADLVPADQQAAFQEQIGRYFSAHQPFSHAEVEMLHKSGRRVLVECSGYPILDESKNFAGFRGACLDITRQKQLEAQFLRGKRLEALGAMASGLAHDLNNILTPILMSSTLLRDTINEPQARAMMETIEHCAKRGADIIRQLLIFARGKPGVRVPLPIGNLLHEVQKIIHETFPRNIQTQVLASSDLWPVLGDVTQIHQALMNLCVNARDAMPEGGRLILSARNVTVDETFLAMVPGAQASAYVCLSVSDTGIGIAQELLESIFDPFFTTKEPGKGTGLGLATVQSIVHGHDGFMRVTSQLGRGATFDLYLPAAAQDQTAAVAPPAPLPPKANGEWILLVDDEPDVCEALRQALENHGYRVLTAPNGKDALQLFSHHPGSFQIVLTDMMMPVMDGPALIRALWAQEPRLPIVGMTGLHDPNAVKDLDKLNLPVMLTKPFTCPELLQTLYNARRHQPPSTFSGGQ